MKNDRPAEIAIVGDLTDHENDITQRLLEVEIGAPCTLYFDSPGGSPYTALSLTTLIRIRELDATGIVTGECSSAALWPFAACPHRFVTPYSMLLFHPLKWQSEENVQLVEAAEWARHFGQLEKGMDDMLAGLFAAPAELISGWTTPHRYVTGPEAAEAGLAKLIDPLESPPAAAPRSNDRSRRPRTRRKQPVA